MVMAEPGAGGSRRGQVLAFLLGAATASVIGGCLFVYGAISGAREYRGSTTRSPDKAYEVLVLSSDDRGLVRVLMPPRDEAILVISNTELPSGPFQWLQRAKVEWEKDSGAVSLTSPDGRAKMTLKLR